jgi:hypothetical protein
MVTNETQQLINLSSFLQDSFLPAAQFLEVSEDRSLSELRDVSAIATARLWKKRQRYLIDPLKYSQASFFESYFWLLLGAEIGFLPSEPLATLVAETFSRLEITENTWNEISRLFPGVLRVAGDSAVRLKKYFPEVDYTPFAERQRLHSLYLAVLAVEQAFTRNELAQRFTTTLTFSLESTWQELIKSPVDRDRLLDALRANVNEGTSHEMMIAGFFIALGHVAAMTDLLSSPQNPTIDYPDRANFSRRVREICFWRINLTDPSREKRYYELAKNAIEFVEQETRFVGLGGNLQPNWANFFKVVTEILNGWKHGVVIEHGRSTAAAGSA